MNQRPTPRTLKALDLILSEKGELCEDTAPKILVQLCKNLERENALLMHEIAKNTVKKERWLRLCFDMLSTYKEVQDFNITQERVECWREEWNQLTGMNYADY